MSGRDEGQQQQGYMLVCQDCGDEFLFSARDQEFFRERDWKEPKRCVPCRRRKKADREGRG